MKVYKYIVLLLTCFLLGSANIYAQSLGGGMFGDDDQNNPNTGTSTGGTFGDSDQTNPNTEGGSDGFSDSDMGGIPLGDAPNITFADPAVKAICVSTTTNWDTNHDGELSEAEAAAVTDLGEVFQGNTEITSFDELQYFTGLTSIGNGAFSECRSLTSIVIPNNVTTIGNNAFDGCTSLTSIAVPNNVTTIGDKAFDNCTNLVSVYMPDNIITFAGSFAFGESNNIESVYITDLAAWLGIDFGSNNPLRSGAKLYLNNVEVKDLVIPEGTTAILTAAFEGCESLTSVTIPSSVTSIDEWAFAKCNNLTSATIPESVTSIGDHLFAYCNYEV